MEQGLGFSPVIAPTAAGRPLVLARPAFRTLVMPVRVAISGPVILASATVRRARPCCIPAQVKRPTRYLTSAAPPAAGSSIQLAQRVDSFYPRILRRQALAQRR